MEAGQDCPLCGLEFGHPAGSLKTREMRNRHIKTHFLAYFCRCGRGASRRQTILRHQQDPNERTTRCETGTVHLVGPKAYSSWCQWYGVTEGGYGSAEYRAHRYPFVPGIVTRGTLAAHQIEVRGMEIQHASWRQAEEVQRNCEAIEKEIVAPAARLEIKD